MSKFEFIYDSMKLRDTNLHKLLTLFHRFDEHTFFVNAQKQVYKKYYAYITLIADNSNSWQ